MQTNNSNDQVKPDEFRAGDIVWCVLYGEGKVIDIFEDCDFPVEVTFPDGDVVLYTADGQYTTGTNRTLFFSEPKVEASVTRPFVPTLVGKRVVVKASSRLIEGTVHSEDKNSFLLESGSSFQKEDVAAIYEVSSENLLKP